MADDLDQPLFALGAVGVGLDQAADRKMNGLPAILVDQSVGGLLNAVVVEAINRIDGSRVRSGRHFRVRDAHQFVVGVYWREQVQL